MEMSRSQKSDILTTPTPQQPAALLPPYPLPINGQGEDRTDLQLRSTCRCRTTDNPTDRPCWMLAASYA